MLQNWVLQTKGWCHSGYIHPFNTVYVLNLVCSRAGRTISEESWNQPQQIISFQLSVYYTFSHTPLMHNISSYLNILLITNFPLLLTSLAHWITAISHLNVWVGTWYFHPLHLYASLCWWADFSVLDKKVKETDGWTPIMLKIIVAIIQLEAVRYLQRGNSVIMITCNLHDNRSGYLLVLLSYWLLMVVLVMSSVIL